MISAYNKQVAMEAVAIGFILVVLYTLIKPLFNINEMWLLFILGAGLHVGFEYLGANKWYCANGAACKN